MMTSSCDLKGTYVALRVLEESARRLRAFCEENGISPQACQQENRLHTTVLYSRVHCPNLVADPSRVYIAFFGGYELFKSEGENALVVKLKATGIENRHHALRHEHGATHDYAEFIPHVTLTYMFDGNSVDHLPSIDFPILLGKEYVEDLKLDA